jgi:hypothetical protein
MTAEELDEIFDKGEEDILTPLRSVWAGVAPRGAIGERGNPEKNQLASIAISFYE